MQAVRAHRHRTVIRISLNMHCPMNFRRQWTRKQWLERISTKVDGPMNRCDRAAAESMLLLTKTSN